MKITIDIPNSIADAFAIRTAQIGTDPENFLKQMISDWTEMGNYNDKNCFVAIQHYAVLAGFVNADSNSIQTHVARHCAVQEMTWIEEIFIKRDSVKMDEKNIVEAKEEIEDIKKSMDCYLSKEYYEKALARAEKDLEKAQNELYKDLVKYKEITETMDVARWAKEHCADTEKVISDLEEWYNKVSSKNKEE